MDVASINGVTGARSASSAAGPVPYLPVWRNGMQGVASLLGTTTQQIQKSVADGQSLPQILHAGGKTLQQGAEAFKSGVQAGMTSAVSAGEITQRQADVTVRNQTNRLADAIHDWRTSSATNAGTNSEPSGSGAGSALNVSV